MEYHILSISTRGHGDIVNLNPSIQAFLERTAIREGLLNVFVPGSTAAITAIEFEDGALQDLEEALERLAPTDVDYHHHLRWNDGNGFSHVRAAVLGPSLTVPVSHNRLLTGTWQQIVLVECDNRPRHREIHISLLGDPGVC
jgi:secondary thiamine-phosphate synthase enzyme